MKAKGKGTQEGVEVQEEQEEHEQGGGGGGYEAFEPICLDLSPENWDDTALLRAYKNAIKQVSGRNPTSQKAADNNKSVSSPLHLEGEGEGQGTTPNGKQKDLNREDVSEVERDLESLKLGRERGSDQKHERETVWGERNNSARDEGVKREMGKKEGHGNRRYLNEEWQRSYFPSYAQAGRESTSVDPSSRNSSDHYASSPHLDDWNKAWTDYYYTQQHYPHPHPHHHLHHHRPPPPPPSHGHGYWEMWHPGYGYAHPPHMPMHPPPPPSPPYMNAMPPPPVTTTNPTSWYAGHSPLSPEMQRVYSKTEEEGTPNRHKGKGLDKGEDEDVVWTKAKKLALQSLSETQKSEGLADLMASWYYAGYQAGRVSVMK